MKISLNWLKDYIELEEKPEDLGNILTDVGLEVEGILKVGVNGEQLAGLLVGEVLACDKHPNADKLKICKVKVGDDLHDIVCGAPNVEQGQKVVVALPGTTLYPTGHEPIKIKKAKIRGSESNGMICSEAEIGISDNHDGILVLRDEANSGAEVKDILDDYQDTVFEIGLTPNRGDATSHFGVARDLKAFFKRDLKAPQSSVHPGAVKTDFKVSVEDPEKCPRYAGVILKNLKNRLSPQWMQNRLRALGLSPINAVVDITNYVMHDLGQPLHAFDLAKIQGGEIVVRVAKKGEKLVTLDEVERDLLEEDLMICDSKKPMCIGGVFGGIDSGVSDSTTEIFLESACFSPVSIRRSSMAHQLKTDAAYRFERGTDPEGVIPALIRAIELFEEILDADVDSEIIDIYPDQILPRRIEVNKEKFWTNIGHRVEEAKVVEILESLDFSLLSNSEGSWTYEVPSYRTEVVEDADIYEEFLRIFGFNNIPLGEEIGSTYFAHFPELTIDEFNKDAIGFFTARGFWEAINNSISNPRDQGHVDPDFDRDSVGLLNPLSMDLSHMRTSMLPGLMENLNRNTNRKSENNSLVEKGKVYRRAKEGFVELDYLAFVREGKLNFDTWSDPERKLRLDDIVQPLSDYLLSIGIRDLDITEGKNPGLEAGGYDLISSGIHVGIFGEVQGSVKKAWSIDTPVFYGELKLESLFGIFSENRSEFRELSKFPIVKRDLSLVIDEGTTYKEIGDIVKKRTGSYLKKLDCFSIFRGKPLEEGKKSYAISFYLERNDRTFNDEELDTILEGLIGDFEKNLNAVIRR